MRFLMGSVVTALSLAGCSGSVETSAQPDIDETLSSAEAFIDVFYSFDPVGLEAVLSAAEASAPRIVFYQGWAEGGNYEVVNRMPCVVKSMEVIGCSITVKDDLIRALGIDFNVTDTFEVSFSDGEIVSVQTSSDDPQAYYDAEKWVQENRPELIGEPCRGFFDGGPTPQECVRAMVRGYAEFAASDDFLETL